MQRPFLMFAVNDHMSDIAVRLSPAFARGVWVDMLCLMQTGEPYGCLRRDQLPTPPTSDPPGMTPQVTPQHDPPGEGSALTPQVTPQVTPRRGKGRLTPQDTPGAGCPPLPKNGSLETLLPYLTNTPPEVVKQALAILERNGVFSRIADGKLAGIIYSRRMRREDEARKKKLEAYQRAQKTLAAKSRNSARREGSALTPQVRGQDTPPTMPPHDAPPGDPPAAPPLRTRTRITGTNTQTPPTPPSQGGTTGKPQPQTPGKKPPHGRGQFDDEAIRRHAELMKGGKRK